MRRLYCISVLMAKTHSTGTGYTTTTKQIMGNRLTASKEEAVGGFLIEMLDTYRGFMVQEVLAMEIAPDMVESVYKEQQDDLQSQRTEVQPVPVHGEQDCAQGADGTTDPGLS